MIRIGPPQHGHGSRRVSGMGSADVSGAATGSASPQQVPDLRDVGFATGTGQQAVVPDTVEAVGQDMDHETADDLIGGQLHDPLSVAGLDAVILPAERDGLGISADQAVVRDRHAVRVAAKIGQHRLGATERRFGVDHPFSFSERGQPSGEGPGVGKPRQAAEEGKSAGAMEGQQAVDEQTPEQPGHNPDVKEEAGAAGNPAGAIR